MIASLRGVLLERRADDVVVEVAGVGYRVTVTPATSQRLGELGREVALQIHHHFREDSQTLYGFPNRDERACFASLIAAHGVGPALALAILSVHDPVALSQILAADDLDALCLVPGVGRRTATRLLVELKAKLDLGDIDLNAIAGNGAAAPRTVRDDVREALAGLGYAPDEIGPAVADLPAEGDVSRLLTQALRSLAVSS